MDFTIGVNRLEEYVPHCTVETVKKVRKKGGEHPYRVPEIEDERPYHY